MLKNANFLEKGCKIAAAPGGSGPERPCGLRRLRALPPVPVLLLPLTDIDLSKRVSSVEK